MDTVIFILLLFAFATTQVDNASGLYINYQLDALTIIYS